MNAEQFKEFMEMMTRSLESQNGSMNTLKENNHVKVKAFYGTDEEDLFEWSNEFEQAAEANNWIEGHRLKIASGYLKGTAADWYKEVKDDVESWKTKSEDEEERKKSLYHLFVEQFAPPERQHRWQIELNSLKQQEFEKVDVYASKFKRLLSRVNLDKGLSDGFIVGMFLSGLKKNNTTFVAVAASKDLNEAIAAARRMEAGNYYGQHPTESQKTQYKLGSN